MTSPNETERMLIEMRDLGAAADTCFREAADLKAEYESLNKTVDAIAKEANERSLPLREQAAALREQHTDAMDRGTKHHRDLTSIWLKFVPVMIEGLRDHD